MKTRILIIGAVTILLVIIIFMARDLFLTRPKIESNPFEFEMDDLKKSDSTQIAYQEIKQFKPGLSEIYGIAVDPLDRVLVSGKEGVEIFTPEGIIQNRWPTEDGALTIATDQKGNIYLGMPDHIEIRDSTGRLIKTWKIPGEEPIITSIAVTDLFVFAADAGRKVVYRYDLSGTLLNRIGEKDPQNSIPGFIVPSPYFDLAPDRNGFIWIANPGRHELEKYNYEGKLLSKWGFASVTVDGFCGCCNPSHFTFLHDGSFVTSEKGIERVKVYSPQGDFKCIVAAPESFEEGTRGLDLTVDAHDRILVLDPVRKNIRILVKKVVQKTDER